MPLTNPVDTAIRDFRARSNEKERLDALFFACELMFRVDALVLGAVFLRHPDCRDDKVRTMLHFKKYSTGDWRDLLQNLVSTLPRSQQFGLHKWFTEMEDETPGVLTELVRLRNLVTHAEERTQPSFVTSILSKAEPLFDQCLDTHPALGEFIECEQWQVALVNSGSPLNCSPLLLSGSARGFSDAIFLYRGCSANRNSYGTLTGKDYWSPDAYRELAELLTAKVARLEWLDSSIPASVLMDRVEHASRTAVARLKEQKIYKPEITVKRPEFDAVVEGFLCSDRKLLIVEGPSGAGKTSSIAQMVENRIGANAGVFLITADQLVSPTFPDSLGDFLRIQGEIGSAFDRLTTQSSDARVLVVLDDLGLSGEVDKALLSLLQWSEHLSTQSCVKICATIRSERLHVFLKDRRDAFPASVIQFQMPLLTTDELVMLAEKLPVLGEDNRNAVLSNRREAALRLGELANGSVKRPCLAVPILEAVGTDAILLPCSAFSLYGEILKRVVLDMSPNGIPRFPIRGRILRKIATVLLDRGANQVPIDDDAISSLVIDPARQEQSLEFEALLSNHILVETCNNYVAHTSFADPRFFEFIAAISLPKDNPEEMVASLVRRSERFPPALAVAAHYLIHCGGAREMIRVTDAILSVSHTFESLMLQVALLDAGSFLKFMKEMGAPRSAEIQTILQNLIHLGEARLAATGAQTMIEVLSCQPDAVSEWRFLRAQALYESDEYDEADRELDQVKANRRTEALMLRAVIAVSRDDYDGARTAYEAVLQREDCCSEEERADALAGLGYVLGRTGQPTEAERCLREAISILERKGDSKNLSEACSDLAELLGEQGRVPEARELLERSFQMSKRAGFLIGMGIVKGLVAQIDLKEGNPDRAEQGLQKLLVIARRVGNRWREAWVLERLAAISAMRGEGELAERYRQESETLFNRIKARRNAVLDQRCEG